MEKPFNTEETVTTPSEPCEDRQRARGKELIRVLSLKPVCPEVGDVWPESRYDLGEFGTKTALGVYRSIKRVLEGVE